MRNNTYQPKAITQRGKGKKDATTANEHQSEQVKKNQSNRAFENAPFREERERKGKRNGAHTHTHT